MYTEVEEYLKAKKPFRVQVTPEQSKEVQKLCFKYGVSWENKGDIISCLNAPQLFIHSGWNDYRDLQYLTYPEIKLKEKDTTMNSTMTKEKITELINAFDTGVEFEVKLEYAWETLNKDINLRGFMDYLCNYEVRIKAKPEYVPWETIEDVLPHIGKIVRVCLYDKYFIIDNLYINERNVLSINGQLSESYFDNHTFLDGTPCGKLKQ